MIIRIIRLTFLFCAFVSVVFSAEGPASCSENGPDSFLILPSPPPAATAIAPSVPASADSVPKRLFGVIPNYKADQFEQVYHPLSARQKYDIAYHDSFDWPNYFLLIGYAAQSQMAAGGFSKAGRFKGFAEYYSRAAADQIISSYVTEGFLPAVLHEDPRFFRLGTGSFWHRSYNAVSRVLVTRKDSGSYGFNVSEVLGNAGCSAFSALYYPDDRTLPDVTLRYGMALGNDALANVLTEFWPDIRRHLPFRHRASN